MLVYVVVGIVMFLIGCSLGKWLEQERVFRENELNAKISAKVYTETNRYHNEYVKQKMIGIENKILKLEREKDAPIQ